MENSTEKKHVLVTGATGYVGRHLVDFLLQKKYEVYVLTRNKQSVFSGQNLVHTIIGDITDDFALPNGIQTIYHCAGVIYQKDEMDKVNIQGTKNIVALAIKNNCTLIYLSSAGITGKTNETIITENTPCHPQNAYEISKYTAENSVLEAIKHNGLRAQILRPTTIFGAGKNTKEDTFLKLIQTMRTDWYKQIGDGVYNIIHVDEVVRALWLLDQDTVPNGAIYILNTPIHYKQLDSIVKSTTPTITQKTQTIPYAVAYLGTLFLTIVCSILHKKNPLTFSRLKALTNTQIYSADKIKKELFFVPQKTVEQYILDFLV